MIGALRFYCGWGSGRAESTAALAQLLDKLGVQPDFLTCGAFKSAAELYMREGPSAEAEKMQNWLLDSMYDSQLELIARGRKVDVARVKEWIDNGVALGWLIDADQGTVYVYRPGKDPERLVGVDHVDGEGPVEGFRLDLTDIWQGL